MVWGRRNYEQQDRSSGTGVISHTDVEKTPQDLRKSSSDPNYNRISQAKTMAITNTRPVYYSQANNVITNFEGEQQGCQPHDTKYTIPRQKKAPWTQTFKWVQPLRVRDPSVMPS